MSVYFRMITADHPKRSPEPNGTVFFETLTANIGNGVKPADLSSVGNAYEMHEKLLSSSGFVSEMKYKRHHFDADAIAYTTFVAPVSGVYYIETSIRSYLGFLAKNGLQIDPYFKTGILQLERNDEITIVQVDAEFSHFDDPVYLTGIRLNY